jgi:hypothetical protein
VSADFRQCCHGYVVILHKAGAGQPITSLLPHKSFTSNGAYVACSRARKSCILHTPNKARLTERLPEGNRRAALDVLSEM